MSNVACRPVWVVSDPPPVMYEHVRGWHQATPVFPMKPHEHKRAKRWTALMFSSSKPKPSELQLRKGALLRGTRAPLSQSMLCSACSIYNRRWRPHAPLSWTSCPVRGTRSRRRRPRAPPLCRGKSFPGFGIPGQRGNICRQSRKDLSPPKLGSPKLVLELEPELIQPHMAQKPVLRGKVGFNLDGRPIS